jgi:hypothetical protein
VNRKRVCVKVFKGREGMRRAAEVWWGGGREAKRRT